MITDNLPKSIGLAAIALVALAIGGCADKANPDNVDRRAVERWNYLIAHEAEKAYDYLTPGFRATQTRENYATSMNNRPVQWKAIAFKSKKCEAERCDVQMALTYAIKMPGVDKMTEVTSERSEKWLLVKGEWFFLPSN